MSVVVRLFVVSSMMLGLGAIRLTAAQPATRDAGDQQSEADAQQARHRAIWEQFLDSGPRVRTQLCVNPYLLELEKAYQLNATQSDSVRSKVEAIAEARRTQMGSLADEYDALSHQAAEIWWNYREALRLADDTPVKMQSFRDNPAYQQAMERMLEIDRQFPVDWDATLDAVESLLPPEQAARGRVEIHKNRIRRAARQAQFEATQSRKAALAAADRFSGAAPDPATKDAMVREVLKNAEEKLADENLPPEVKAQIRTTIQRTKQQLEMESPKGPRTSQANSAIARDFDRWEAYTREFISRHHLSAEQQAAALSIMTELRSRAQSMKRTLAERTEETTPSEQAKLDKQRATIDERIAKLFDQLVRRLESLLTAEQRRATHDTPAETVKPSKTP